MSLEPYLDGQKTQQCHFVPQHRFIADDDGRALCDRVLRFDRLADELTRLLVNTSSVRESNVR